MSDQIERKLLLKPVPAIKFPMKSAVFIGIIYGLPLLMMISGKATMGALVWGIGGGAAFGFLFSMIYARAAMKSSERIMKSIAPLAKKALIEFIGSEPRYLDARGTITRNWQPPMAAATGMAWDGLHIYIVDDGEVAKVPWNAIRTWSWKIEGFGTSRLIGANGPAGAVAQAQNNAINANASAAAKRESGFFIEVADVDRPVMQFRTDDEKVLRRWQEIMTQINEGTLATV